MAYHPDFTVLSLDYLAKRLKEEDLIPSHMILRENLTRNLDSLSKAGIKKLAELESTISNSAKILALSKKTSVPVEYLTILSRAVRGYKVKPVQLSDFPGIPVPIIKKIAALGIKNSKDLYEATETAKALVNLSKKNGIDKNILSELAALCSLARIQWVSALFARLLYDAGFTTVKSVSKADGKDIYVKVDAINKAKKLYKGKIGEKDMSRLVFLAKKLMETE